MARRRQLVLIRLRDPEDRLSPTIPLGTEREFHELVAPFNTAPDGSPSGGTGSITYYGPGMIIEIAPVDGEVRQALVSCQVEDFAWPTLYRMCRTNKWKLQDMESGQLFG